MLKISKFYMGNRFIITDGYEYFIADMILNFSKVTKSKKSKHIYPLVPSEKVIDVMRGICSYTHAECTSECPVEMISFKIGYKDKDGVYEKFNEEFNCMSTDCVCHMRGEKIFNFCKKYKDLI